MGIEIERKFLVTGEEWRIAAEPVLYRQAYLSSCKNHTVRVRVAGTKGFLTVKGRNRGLERPEFEYEIPLQDAVWMLENMTEFGLVEKLRYKIPHAGFIWEVDEFLGKNSGLIIAEIELQNANQLFPKPGWLGREVSDDPRYFNANLAMNPYSLWKGEDRGKQP